MNEPFYLDEKNYENVVHSYKSILPKSITNEEIVYDFPDGDCLMDNFCLVVKFDGDIVPKNNLTLEDFVSKVEPYYSVYGSVPDVQPSFSSYHTNPIPSEFAAAYTEICKLNKNKLCFTIPLLRMVSIFTEKNPCHYIFPQYIKRPHIKLIRQQKYQVDPVSIFQEMKDVNLENMPNEVMSSITNYAQSKIQFELFYRETIFFTGINKKIAPELIETYVLDTYEIKFDNTNTGSVVVVDETTYYNYKNILIVLNLESIDTINSETVNHDNNYLDEIVIKTKFSSKFNLNNTTFKNFVRDGSLRLTKELAEIFNINYQVGLRYYLIDISKFITAYVQSITRSGGMYDHICLEGKLAFDEIIVNNHNPANFNKASEFCYDIMDTNKNIKKLVGDIDMMVDIVGIALDLQLTLKKSDTGVANIYFF
ncbi:putative orfan [Tupanvirus soda lake]|uniref:Orfan n=2 Tax=Tupanvirus TaxID=2094720 RepID=A0AC62ADQ4_9VIRU|nr:putative orfan [Tupanvirus soda lake]QKU35801.1 putative orfan [Tupanvirus soda lake]